MSKINKVIDSFNISELLLIEEDTFVINPEKLDDFYFLFSQYLKYFDKNKLNIPRSSDLIIEKFPFINQPNNQIILDIMQRNEAIKKNVKASIAQRSSSEIKFPNEGNDDKKIATYSKTIIKSLNNFIYKNKINKFWTDLVLINDNNKSPYLCNTEILCTNGKEYFVCLLKFSKSPYIEKYKYESELINNTIKKLFNVEIKETILINIMSEQAVSKI